MTCVRYTQVVGTWVRHLYRYLLSLYLELGLIANFDYTKKSEVDFVIWSSSYLKAQL
jgi:hypothetical protein